MGRLRVNDVLKKSHRSQRLGSFDSLQKKRRRIHRNIQSISVLLSSFFTSQRGIRGKRFFGYFHGNKFNL